MDNTQSALATPAPLRRRLTGGMLVLGLTLATIAMTASPVEAASAVVSCHKQVGNNFFLNGLTVKLMAVRFVSGYSPSVFEVDRTVTDAGGCAVFYVPPQFYGEYLYTTINHMDVGYFYGSYYSSGLNWSAAWIPQWGQLYYHPNFGGFAFPGDHIWYLEGWVSCQTCRWA